MRVPSNLVNGSGKFAFAGKLAPAGRAATAQSRPGFSTKSLEPLELEDELLEELELDDELLLDLPELDEELLEDELLDEELLDEELLEEELLEEELEEDSYSPPQPDNAVTSSSSGQRCFNKLGVKFMEDSELVDLFFIVSFCVDVPQHSESIVACKK